MRVHLDKRKVVLELKVKGVERFGDGRHGTGHLFNKVWIVHQELVEKPTMSEAKQSRT